MIYSTTLQLTCEERRRQDSRKKKNRYSAKKCRSKKKEFLTGKKQVKMVCFLVMVFNATFNNISVICGGQFYWWRKPSIYCKSLTNFITYDNDVWSTSRHEQGSNSQTLVMLGTD